MVRVKLFAAVKEAVGGPHVDIDVPETASIAELRQALSSRAPEVAGVIDRATFAVGCRYAVDSDPIPSDAEIACIPPVSGG